MNQSISLTGALCLLEDNHQGYQGDLNRQGQVNNC